MEAKDTVMMEKEIGEICYAVRISNFGQLRKLCKAQAEISFKAGHEKRKKEIEMVTVSLAEMCLKHRKFGRKEVVEWIEKNKKNTIYDAIIYSDRRFFDEEWQAQCNRWSVK